MFSQVRGRLSLSVTKIPDLDYKVIRELATYDPDKSDIGVFAAQDLTWQLT